MAKPIAEARLEHGSPLAPDELARHPIFEGIPRETLEKFPGAVVLRRFDKGEVVCRQGDDGFTAFYLLSGKVEVALELSRLQDAPRARGGWTESFRNKLAGRPARRREGTSFIPIDAPVDLRIDDPIAFLEAGDLFGEMTCLNRYPRSATVRAVEPCELLEMLGSVLTLLQKRSPVLKSKLESAYRERALKTHLRGVEAFQGVPDEFLNSLAERAELVRKEDGGVIVRQGEAADAMFLIRLGFVKVSHAAAGGERVLHYLHRGDVLGAAGILGRAPRSATCTALGDVELVRIRKQDVEEMIGRFAGVRGALEKDLQRAQAPPPARADVSAPVPIQQFMEQGLIQARSLLLIDLDKCTRCDDCVRACADSHDGVTRLVRDGLRVDRYLVPSACRACTDPLCMVGCPVGSIRRGATLEIVIEDWCIGCGLCARQCPYGAIALHPKTENPAEKRAATCDLCAGWSEPNCVYACPHEAAVRVDPSMFLVESV